jgi:hypothetical protein
MFSSPAALPPQQVEQAVISLRGEDSDPLGPGLDEAPLQAEVLADPPPQHGLQFGPDDGKVGDAEDGPLEEAPAGRVGRVLVEGDDVRSCPRQHGGYARHDAGTVLPMYDQAPFVPGAAFAR